MRFAAVSLFPVFFLKKNIGNTRNHLTRLRKDQIFNKKIIVIKGPALGKIKYKAEAEIHKKPGTRTNEPWTKH